MSYYNTNNLSTSDKEVQEQKTERQKDKVLKVLQFYACAGYTSWEVQELYNEFYGESILITSVRRSLSGLIKDGIVIKTEATRMERHGVPNHLLKLVA